MKICNKHQTYEVIELKSWMKTRIVHKIDTNCFSQGIKGADTMANLVRANTYISGYVMHNLVGIVIHST